MDFLLLALHSGVLALSALARQGDAVPTESESFDPDLHVPDISDSEAVPHEERRESEIGCHWTARLTAELCGASGCHDAEILAFDFQERAWLFYDPSSSWRRGSKTSGAIELLVKAPPLDEAFWIASMPRDELLGVLDLCPGLVITALLLVAEVELTTAGASTGPREALEAAAGYAGFVMAQQPADFEIMQAMWPVNLGHARCHSALMAAEARAGLAPTSLDLVVARCGASLLWLRRLMLPTHVRLWLYEACHPSHLLRTQDQAGESTQLAEIAQQLPHIRTIPASSAALLHGSHGAKFGRSAWALQTFVRHALEERSTLADITVFVPDDAPQFVKPEFLRTAVNLLSLGLNDVPFLSLAHTRQTEVATPLLRALYEEVLGNTLRGRLGGYRSTGGCVINSQTLQNAIEGGRLERLQAWLEGSTHSESPTTAAMRATAAERIWHAVFGEEDVLPLRSEDPRLPLALRYEGGRSTLLPSPLKFSAYACTRQ